MQAARLLNSSYSRYLMNILEEIEREELSDQSRSISPVLVH